METNFEQHRVNKIIPAMIRHDIKQIPGMDEGKPLMAFVNHGRWLVKCECGGAEYAWEEGLFMCFSCFNSAHKHNFRRAVFPEGRAIIERLLEVRPLLNRNFLLTDTVKVLEAENEEHKAELLEVI